MLTTAILVVAAYLAGSVSSAVIVSRMLGLPDPRTVGSGNPGATNVLRHGGKKAAALTLVGDFLKGLVPVVVASLFGLDPGELMLVALAAFFGHLYPVFFGFKGGKGVATGLGVLLGLDWRVGLATIATWLAMAAVFRISSLSALVAMGLAPLYVWLAWRDPYAAAGAVLLTTVLYWRHRSNIRNLLGGREDRFDRP
ncbi:MAG: glycerol-3-phosphate 1-O-acyltransferase PlsY [Chromatiales bacterium]|nr:glycerol-3-phosphate 1-O-acyltransferase PlsY [Chromatiales bacterium]